MLISIAGVEVIQHLAQSSPFNDSYLIFGDNDTSVSAIMKDYVSNM